MYFSCRSYQLVSIVTLGIPVCWGVPLGDLRVIIHMVCADHEAGPIV